MTARPPVARRVAPVGAVLVIYSVLLLVAVLSPTNSEQSSMVVWLAHRLHQLGVPAHLATSGRLEVLLNALIVAPVSFLGSVLRPRTSWRDWTAYGFGASVSVELVQLVVLPGRQASFSDVVANTAGALLGAVAIALLRRLTPGSRVRRSSGRR
jgi:glycopeptide antibiotics resistance protein